MDLPTIRLVFFASFIVRRPSLPAAFFTASLKSEDQVSVKVRTDGAFGMRVMVTRLSTGAVGELPTSTNPTANVVFVVPVGARITRAPCA